SKHHLGGIARHAQNDKGEGHHSKDRDGGAQKARKHKGYHSGVLHAAIEAECVSRRRQAAVRSSPTGRRAGALVRQRSVASGQRGWKGQPEGRLAGFGGSPWSTRRPSSFLPGTGTLETKARV